jgi:hypothetical protein
MKPAWLELPDGQKHLLSYKEVDGLAIADGDIVIGRVDELQSPDGLVDKGAILVKAGTFWPSGVVNYSSTSMLFALPAWQVQMVNDAMEVWSDATGIVWNDCPGRVPRDPDTGLICNDVVAFNTLSEHCAAELGKKGGTQQVWLSTGCEMEEIVHELGHTLGLFHEQARIDRNDYVNVYHANMVPDADARLANYGTWLEQGVQGGDVAAHQTCQMPWYNFDSQMHYDSWSLAAEDGDWPAMLRKAEATMDGPAPHLYKWDSLYTWKTLRGTSHSNTNLGYGLFTSDARTDLFLSNGTDWFTSSAGTGAWVDINTSSYRYRKARTATTLLLGDFDGNGRTDVMREDSSRWYVAWNGAGGWVQLNADSKLNGVRVVPRDLIAGDFNGDEKTDMLAGSGGNWYVRYGGTGAWQVYADNAADMPSVWTVSFGDFNGDDETDAFRVSGGNWQIYVPWNGTWENYDTGNADRGPLVQNATAGSWSNSVALGDFDGNGLTDVLHTFDGTLYYALTKLDDFEAPYPDINLMLSKTLTPLHFDNWNLNFVHTCKTLSSGTYSGQRRCHSGPDINGDGITDLISSQISLAEPHDGRPLLSRGDIWALCSRYPSLGGKCASGGNWTTATCPQDVP